MCGIAGWVAAPQRSPVAETLGAMLQAMAHRGPDDEGACSFTCASGGQRVFLGHRRLAIIDPQGARQPMCDAQAGLALTFNGEIYNFRELRRELAATGLPFERDSDTEVLLRAYQHWGAGAVPRLRGQFAFAVWDARRERLFLARDRFGEKPLFLLQDGADLYFASEVKALLRLPRAAPGVDLEAVWDYLAYRYVPAPRTLLRGVQKLLPGMTATWERGALRLERYWTAPDRAAGSAAPAPRDAVAGFLARLDEAVRLQMVSDVPFGAFLSGGIDSSTIVALMRRHSANVRTFSVGFGEAGYSELAVAGEVAQRLGTRHHELVVAEADIARELPALVGYRDAPVSEPSDVPVYLLARAAAREVKMVLTGEGSDELLGGYPKHLAERYAAGWQRLPRVLRQGFIGPLAHALPYGWRRIKTAVANLNIEDWRERQVRWFGALDCAGRESLSVLRLNGSTYGAHPPFDADPRASALRRILYFDQSSWLPDNLLERADRMTMAASIEARVPFLDHELAAYVSALPDRFRVRAWRGKWILRQAGRGLVPARVLARAKVGFRVPVNAWFRGTLREYLLAHLRGADCLTRAYYEPRALERVLSEHLDGRHNHEKLLWTLLNLEIWHRQYARA